MITKENIKWCFENLTKENVDEVFSKEPQYVEMELHTFNGGSYPTITGYNHFDVDIDNNAEQNGNIFCDVDTFLQLYEELNAFNQHLFEYL